MIKINIIYLYFFSDFMPNKDTLSISLHLSFELDDSSTNDFYNSLLPTAINVGLAFDASFNDSISIYSNNLKDNFTNKFYSLICTNGLIIIDGLDNKPKKIEIQKIIVEKNNNSNKKLLKIISGFNFFSVKEIKNYISKIIFLFKYLNIEKVNMTNLEYQLCMVYTKNLSMYIKNLFTLKDIEKAILYESIRYEDAIRKNTILDSEIRIFKKNVTIFEKK